MMKQILCSVAAALLLVACSGADTTAPPPVSEPESNTVLESPQEPATEPEQREPDTIATTIPIEASFATPDEAIHAYVAGVASGELFEALSACAIQSYGQGYNIRARVDVLQQYQADRDMGPSQFDLYSEANAAIQLGNLAAQTKLFAECLTTYDTELPDGMAGGIWAGDNTAEGTLDSYFNQMNPNKLTSLIVSEILIPTVIDENAEDTQAFLAYNALQSGADESTQRIVVLDHNGQIAVCSFQLLRYGADWKIQSHGATLSGMVNSGMAVILTTEELEEFKAEFTI